MYINHQVNNLSSDQYLNYICVEILEKFVGSPSENQIKMLEKALFNYLEVNCYLKNKE